ncbi:hypothetical protein BH20ACI2_BH20ACI2_24750 [soil metagenome]
MKRVFSSRIGKWSAFAVVAVSAYFINVEAQSYLGRRAIVNTGLVSVPFDEARAQAEREGKIILVDVSAVWCPNCRRLDNDVFSNADVRRAINSKFIFSRIEYESEEGEMFLRAYSTSGFPSLWLIRGDGSVVKRLDVTFSPEEFISQLNK